MLFNGCKAFLNTVVFCDIEIRSAKTPLFGIFNYIVFVMHIRPVDNFMAVIRNFVKSSIQRSSFMSQMHRDRDLVMQYMLSMVLE